MSDVFVLEEGIELDVDANDANECPTQLIMTERSTQQKKRKGFVYLEIKQSHFRPRPNSTSYYFVPKTHGVYSRLGTLAHHSTFTAYIKYLEYSH